MVIMLECYALGYYCYCYYYQINVVANAIDYYYYYYSTSSPDYYSATTQKTNNSVSTTSYDTSSTPYLSTAVQNMTTSPMNIHAISTDHSISHTAHNHISHLLSAC